MYSIPCSAQENVNALLQQLSQATAAEAVKLDRAVQKEWSKSGSAAMDLLLKRGREALEDGDSQAAIEHFTALTDHAPDFPEGWHARAIAYFEADLHGPALADLQRALALNPDNYNAIYGLGVLFEQFDDLTRANDLFQRVLGLHPHHEQATKAVERLRARGIGRTL